jgi:hypothetical protein
MDHMKRRAVKEMEANAKVASAASGVAQQMREAKVMKEMQGLEITDEEIMDTSATNESIRYGGVVPSSPSQWEVRIYPMAASVACASALTRCGGAARVAQAEEVCEEDIPDGTPTRG